MRLFAGLFLVASALCNAQIAVLNGASFRTNQPVASGSWAAVFGTFTGVAQATASTSPIPKSLGGVSVTVDGVEAPVYFVSASQINFLIPASVQPGLRPVQVKTGAATLTGNVRIMTSAPGIFVRETPTTPVSPLGAALNQDGSINGSNSPSKRGEVIQIYATGPGAVDAAIADGAPAPSAPLARTRSTPQVFIGGVAAEVQFSGMAPNLAGVWQCNAFVPNRNFISGRVPVQIFVDGVDSNEVSIFVAQ